MKARIRIISGPLAGQTIDLSDGTLLIGREEDCQLRLTCDFLSRRHCALELSDLTLRIRDLGSKNGTYVNGRRIGSNEEILLHDDLVAVGTMSFLIDIAHERQPELIDTRGCDTGTISSDPAPPAQPEQIQTPPEQIPKPDQCADRATD
jgi:pSer/pThr/pTyr-binding forkhead associated (FHA) protein